MTLYICGPMSGYPDFNYPAFDAMASLLKSKDYDVINPADIGRDLDSRSDSVSYEQYLKASLAALLKCDGIVLLWGWEDSKGAFLERSIAITLKMQILYDYQIVK